MRLRPGVLDRIRARQNDLQPLTGRIQTRLATPDGQGGMTTTWVAGRFVAVRIAQPTAEQVAVDRVGQRPDHILTVSALTSIREGDRIVVGSRTFEVLTDGTDRTWETARRLECREIR